ncbi:cyanophycinase [Oryzobacter telluris]|uniref:cyanophycinase n=1 Tax=Oryzobacter telluris TaxID=3149179 RepID=UPI00370D6308
MPRYPTTTPTLFVIGGAEDRVGKASLLRHFLKLCGGRRSTIVVIPTASSFQDEVGASYTEVFTRLGASSVTIVNPATREEAHDPELVAAIDAATGVFMSGGSQLRLSQLLPGTPLGDALHRAHDRGCVVGGTSAGASIVSDFMISMGDEGVTPRQRASQVTAGLGLLRGVVVDQHFDQRARYGRLMSVIAPSPHLLGVGIDEDTAMVVSDGREFEVRGSGAVFVLDCTTARTDAADARAGAPVLVSGAIVHTLPAGSTFDLVQRRLSAFVEQHPDLLVSVAASKA